MSEQSELARLTAGLLVGGSSRRMGRPKALVELGGVSLAERVATVLGAVCSELVLLGDGPVPAAMIHEPRLKDAPGLRGPMAALLAALRARPDSAWLVAACDQPLVSPEACRWLLSERRPDRLAVLPRFGDGPAEPLLAIYEPAAREVLERMAAAGERSLQPFSRSARVASPEPPSVLAEAWTSVDSETDLAALVSRLGLDSPR